MKQSIQLKKYKVIINNSEIVDAFGTDKQWATDFIKYYGIPGTKLELVEI